MELFDDVAALRKVLGQIGATDEALIAFEADAEAAIDRIAGPVGDVVEYHHGESRFVLLNRQAAAVTRVTEGTLPPTVLATDDWRLRDDRRSLERLPFGTNPAWWLREQLRHRFGFRHQVKVEYTPVDDIAIRRSVAVALVRASITGAPGVLGMTEGNFSIQYANGETFSVTRDDVLESVGPLWNFA